MEYVVLKYNTVELLSNYVNQRLGSGWKCQGGVATSASTFYTTYYQAMIKESK